MNLIEVKDKDTLNNFLMSFSHSRFLQSFDWGEFQEEVGFKIFRLGVEDSADFKAAATLIKKKLPFGNYFYCPHGPIFKDISASCFFFDKVTELAHKEKAAFIRFEPEENFKSCKIKTSRTLDVQPKKTLVLDLSKSEEELLSGMHQKTRYNIRLAEKKGVTIRRSDISEFEKFWSLLEKTGRRDSFRLHNREYYKKMLGIDDKYIKLFFGEFQGEIICAGIFSLFGDTATYIHGASGDEYKNVMAPYLLHWQAIKQFRLWGFKYYDFFGIDEKKWPGVTRFKKGFGGKEIEYPGTFDLVFNNKFYSLYKLGRKIRGLF